MDLICRESMLIPGKICAKTGRAINEMWINKGNQDLCRENVGGKTKKLPAFLM